MKEKAVISYNKGISNSPSDFICEDGMLAECVNMEVKENELIPVQMPVKLSVKMNDGELLLKIHNIPNSDVKNYVYTKKDGNNTYLSIFHIVNDSRIDYTFSKQIIVEDIRSVETLGNTVIVYDKNNVHYFLYSDGSYKYLGNELPKISLSFNLSGDYKTQIGDDQVIVQNQRDSKNPYVTEDVAGVYTAAISKFISEKATEEGKFMYPFFVRYALVLFNGELVRHSAPILMIPSTMIAPQILEYGVTIEDGKITTKFAVGSYVADLQYKVNSIDTLDDWADIVKGVEIYISRQTVSYDQNYHEDDFIESFDYNRNFYIGKINKIDKFTDEYSPSNILSGYRRNRISNIYDSSAVWQSPKRISANDFNENLISNSSIYYKYTTLSIGNLKSSSDYTTLNTSNGYIVSGVSTIEVENTMVDDYMTNDVLIPSFATVYNGRLNIANIERRLFVGFAPESMVQPLDATVRPDGSTNESSLSYFDAYVYIHTASGDTVIVKKSGNVLMRMAGNFFFYPDTDAYKMVLVDRTSNKHVTLNMVEHPGLNGAYAFVNLDETISFTSGVPSISVSENPKDKMLNKLFTSDVNNPFYFPLAGINTIGNDEILGLSAMTRPISQGQFGQYPLIAFCSDGNYALKVDTNGYYSGISPIQEDVVIGSSKITSLEDSIVIVTQRGLMLTTGGEITKLATHMDGASFDSTTLENAASWNEEFRLMLESSVSHESFITYLYGAKIAYDYSLNRLFIYNPEKTYSYIYNLDNQSVSKIVFGEEIKSINSILDYPDTIIQNSDGSLYSLYKKEDISSKTEHQKGLIITRALKFGSMMDLKSIFRIRNIHSGFDKESYVKCNIYGSNDGVNYYLSASRFGKPYKFYRMVIYTNLLPKETLSGTIFEFEKRRTNKLR